MRLCVFCFYNKDGIVFDYIPAYLKELKKVSDAIDVVVNGTISEEGKEKIKEYARNTYIRENTGYDGGAYAEYFNEIADKEELKNCERIILVNDTVFGPLVPMEKIFEKMTTRKYDFWGIMEQSRKAIRYLISFFIVFEKKIIEDGALFEYFKEYGEELKTGDYNNTLALFERCISPYMRQRGYRCGSYVDIPYYDVFYSADHCVIKGGLPVVKKKILNYAMYGKMQLDMILEYIRTNTDYDEKLLIQCIEATDGKPYVQEEHPEKDKKEKLDRIAFMNQFDSDEDKITEFIKTHDEIYIYGAGLLGKTIYYAYRYYLENMKGFIVSDPSKAGTEFLGHPITGTNSIPANAGVIVAMDRLNTKEVKKTVEDAGKDALYLWK